MRAKERNSKAADRMTIEAGSLASAAIRFRSCIKSLNLNTVFIVVRKSDVTKRAFVHLETCVEKNRDATAPNNSTNNDSQGMKEICMMG